MSPLGTHHHMDSGGMENLDGTCDETRLLGIRLTNETGDTPTTPLISKRRKRNRRNLYKMKKVQIKNRPTDKARQDIFGTRRTVLSFRNAKKKRVLPQAVRKAHLSPSGDVLTTQDNWPKANANGTIRILHINIHGITPQNDYLDWDIMLGYMADLQVDCMCITEPNLDLNSFQIRDTLRYTSKQFDRHLSLTMTSSRQNPAKRGSAFKPGGTITAINGVWSGRIQHGIREMDKFSRWGSTHLLGKQGIITIITVYRVCKQANGAGDNTVYLQQQADLERVTKHPCDPRERLCQDLEVFINTLHTKGHKVILSGDFNEDLAKQGNRVNNMLAACNMSNVMSICHPNVPLPTTYDKGTNCVDMIAISDAFNASAVKKAGFLPFYQPFASDHRAVFCDLDVEQLFGAVKPDTVRPVYRQFHTKNVKKCDQYLHSLENKLSRAKIFQQVSDLKEAINKRNKLSKCNHEELIHKCKLLETKTHQLMKAAHNSLGKTPYANGYWHSREVIQAGHERYCAKKALRRISVGLCDDNEMSVEEAKDNLHEATVRLKEAQQCSRETRDELLKKLATKRAQEWRMQESSAIKIITNAEKAKQRFAKISRSTKGTSFGSLRKVLVPAPISDTSTPADTDDPSNWITVDDPDHLHSILLRRNAHHLSRSRQSMFAQGPMLQAVGWDAMGPEIHALLEGTLDAELLSQSYPEFGTEASTFIKALRYPVSDTGVPMTDKFIWKFGKEEYHKVFGKTSEITSCGPSGLHMSYWKAALERDCIAEVHSFFIWAAFELGFAYERWQTSWHCMLQKKKEPYYHKLRIIQLFEGDFNAGLKYLLGRLYMYHLVDQGFITPETYGSIPGRTAQEAMSLLQQIFDNHRLTRRNMLADFNDAAGCYDCIRQNLASICAMRLGCTMLLMLCHCVTQLLMQHYVRTAAGISKGYMKWGDCEQNPEPFWDDNAGAECFVGNFGGVGQGGGGSPVLWLSVMLPMLDTYKSHAEGAAIQDPLELIALTLWVLSYVDDNTLVRTFSHSIHHTTLWELASQEFGSWHRTLQITGGDLALEKCTCTIMKWKWTGIYGLPSLASEKDFPGTITVKSALDADKPDISLLRLEPWQAQRQLGIRLPVDGSMNLEFQHRVQQGTTLAAKLYKAPLTAYEAYAHFRQYFIPALTYPFPVTTFSSSQCQEIQRKYIHALLPKLGINRHMPRATIYAPTALGGAALLDLRVLQPMHQLQTLQQHLRRQDATGMALCANYRALQVLVGSATSFLQLSPDHYKVYIDSTNRWKYIWEVCHAHDISIHATFLWAPMSKFGKADANLMDTAVHHPQFQGQRIQLHAINACRMYLQVFYLSDMVTYTGRHIIYQYLDGTKKNPNPICRFPHQPFPTSYQWGIWRKFITGTFLCGHNKLQCPLNPCLVTPICTPQHHSSTLLKQFQQVMDNSLPSTPVEELIASLPVFLQFLLQGTNFLHDVQSRATIAQGIMAGTFSAATDGSLLPASKRGTCGVVLCPTDDPDNVITCASPIPSSQFSSSLTAEHYGLITLGMILHILYATEFKPIAPTELPSPKPPTIPVYIDNIELVKRGNKIKPTRLTLKEHSVPDYDLWELSNGILRTLPLHLECEWVKSHQDEETAVQDLDLPARLNVSADRCANDAHTITFTTPTLNKPFVDTGVLGYFSHNGSEIHDLLHYFTERIHSAPMEEYLTKKFRWSHQTLRSISWRAISMSLHRLPVPQRLKQLQFLYNWQNVGQQKVQFAQARAQTTNTPLEHAHEKDLYACPLGCGKGESHGHYMLCNSAVAITTRDIGIRTITQVLRGLQTCPGIIRIFQIALTEKDPSISILSFPSHFDQQVETTMRSQSQIGWDAFRRGFISTQWGILQEHYARTELNLHSFDVDSWAAAVAQQLWAHGHAMWDLRNEGLHGKTHDESRGKRIHLLQKRVRQLYSHDDRKYIPPTQQAQYFGLPVAQRKKQGIYALTAWIKMIERRLHYHREEAMKRTIHAWLEKEKNGDRIS